MTSSVPSYVQQRVVSWTASPAMDVLGVLTYTVTCSDGTPADTRTVTVSGSTTSVTMGSGTGNNAPLAAKATYTCSVTATNLAGTSSAGYASSFPVIWCNLVTSVSYIYTSSELFSSPYYVGSWQDTNTGSGTSSVVLAPLQLSGVSYRALRLSTSSGISIASAYFNYRYGTECSAVCGGYPYDTGAPYCGSQSPIGYLNSLTAVYIWYYRASGGSASATVSPQFRLRIANQATPLNSNWADLGEYQYRFLKLAREFSEYSRAQNRLFWIE